MSLSLIGILIDIWVPVGAFPASGWGAIAPRDEKRPAAPANMCRRIVLQGEVEAGKAWKTEIGEGWIFEVEPISGSAYTGWDLVVDRAGVGAGYPDALLVATPPYGSLNEREIGTTFGLRAQDAIGWEPRRFHFLLSVDDLAKARNWFGVLTRGTNDAARQEAGSGMIKLIGRSGSGEMRILDAKLVPGEADPKGFGQRWGANLAHVPHTVVQEPAQSRQPGSARGEIRWMRFEVTLWLPSGWQLRPGIRAEKANCSQ